MRVSITTEQLLAIEQSARKTLAQVKPKARRQLKKLWVEAQNAIVEEIIANLEVIDRNDVQVFANWLDKFRILNHFLHILEKVEAEATDG